MFKSLCKTVFLLVLACIFSQSERVEAFSYNNITEQAFKMSQSPFVLYLPVPIPELDPPAPDDEPPALGLSFDEYNTLDTTKKIFDDHIWWAISRPRGNVNKDLLKVFNYDIDKYLIVPYIQSDYDYKTPEIQPPLPDPIPLVGRYITALNVGKLQIAGSYPQVLHIGGDGYLRLTGFPPLEFGSSLRMGVIGVGSIDEQFPKIKKVYIRNISEDLVNIMGILDSRMFTASFTANLRAGNSSSLSVSMTIFLRKDYSPVDDPEFGPVGISSMFWKGRNDTPEISNDQAHDSDTIKVRYSDGTYIQKYINIPAGDKILLTNYAKPATQISSFALLQKDRIVEHYTKYPSAHYENRSSNPINITSSSVPYTVMFYRHSTDNEYYDNIVAFVRFTTKMSAPASAGEGIKFNYVLKGSP